MHIDITPEELQRNAECGLKTFLAIKFIEKKRFFGLLSPILETKVVAHTRASNFLWAESHFIKNNIDYDFFIEIKDRVYHPLNNKRYDSRKAS